MTVAPFQKAYRWYKGNLHTHTTRSDGAFSPKDTVALYAALGMDFLALTDHRQFADFAAMDEKLGDLLLIPGVEADINFEDAFKCHHMVALAPDTGFAGGFAHGDPVDLGRPAKGPADGQALIDYLNAKGCAVFLAHPVWSRTELSDFVDFQGLVGMEVYNHFCYYDGNTSTASVYWDSLLRRGKRVWGLATDDYHRHSGARNAGGGWIAVNAPELSARAVVDAIREGRFYASSGPEIYDFRYEDGVVSVECSPVSDIHFIQWEMPGFTVSAEAGGTIAGASHKVDTRYTRYVRAECVDAAGHTAWTNPIFLSDDPAIR